MTYYKYSWYNWDWGYKSHDWWKCWEKDPAPEDECKVVQEEDFDWLCDPDDSRDIISDGRWDIRNNQLYTDGCNDGTVLFKEVAADGPVELTFDIKSKGACYFENDDVLKVEVQIDGGDWVTLDEFRVNGHNKFVGSQSGQTFGDYGSSLTYEGGVLDDVESSVQFRVTSDFSYYNERMYIDDWEVKVCPPVNEEPEADDDAASVCATEAVVVDVLDNDSDPDGDALSIMAVNGQEVQPGDVITLASGAEVTVNADGTLSYDSSNGVYGGIASEDLLIGEEAGDSFAYTISDGNGGEAEALVDLTVCGGKNTVQTIAERVVPEEGCMVVEKDASGEFGDFTVTISNTGNEAIDGVFEQAYCLDFDAVLPSLASGDKIDVNVEVAGGEPVDYDVTSPNQASPDLEEDVDNIGWILNEDFGSQDNGDGTGETYTETEIAAAIWGVTNLTVKDTLDADGIPDKLAEAINGANDGSTIENAMEIYTGAITEGEGYEATEAGDIVALILTPNGSSDDVQPFVVGVDFEDLEEDCECELV